jgi:glycerophosphoryl diester phosphodiesterase
MRNIAHRGASGHAPENTLAAFQRAAKMGAQFIETDLRLTADGHIVALHDATVNRTTNGRGRISRMSLAQVRTLNASAHFAGRNKLQSFAGERIPTLEDVLDFGRTAGIGCYLELKSRAGRGLEERVVRALRAAKLVLPVVVISFHAASLRAIRELNPRVTTGFLVEKSGTRAVQRTLEIGARQLLPRADRATPALLAAAREAGLDVVVWTVNETSEMRRLIAAGVDGIITNYPDRLAALIRSR